MEIQQSFLESRNQFLLNKLNNKNKIKMSIKKALLIELEREKANTKRIISRLNNESFGYKPHQKSRTLGE